MLYVLGHYLLFLIIHVSIKIHFSQFKVNLYYFYLDLDVYFSWSICVFPD